MENEEARKILFLAKADPIGDVPIQAVSIYITNELAHDWANMGEWDKYCNGQARQLEAVLVSTLPGGTYDRLLGHMLARKASHFRVAHVKGGE